MEHTNKKLKLVFGDVVLGVHGDGFSYLFSIRPVESNLYVFVEKNGCTGPRLRPSGGHLQIMTGAADFRTVLLCGWEQICSGRRKK